MGAVSALSDVRCPLFVEDGEQGFGGAPEDGGSDGTLGDGEEGSCQLPVVSCQLRHVTGAELAAYFGEGEADAVAVGEGRRGVELDFRQREAGVAEECLEAGRFLPQLGGVGEVLELAAAAGAEVRAGRRDVICRFDFVVLVSVHATDLGCTWRKGVLLSSYQLSAISYQLSAMRCEV